MKTYMRASIFSICIMALVPLLLWRSGYCQTTRELARRAMESVCMLVMEDSNGQMNSLGSGFVVKNGVVVTNLHVLEGASRGYVKFIGSNTKRAIEGVFVVDASHDLAVLSVSTVTAKPMSLGISDTMEVGDPVYVIGNPQGMEGTFSQGIVSGIRSFGSDKILQITAPISPGSSGGPVLNATGQAIGVAVATLRGGQNLNFAVPSNYIRPLLSNLQSTTSLSRNLIPSGTRSVLADFGARSSDAVVAGQWAWDQPILYGVAFPQHGAFSFSLKNGLNEAVRNIYCLAVFYDNNLDPIDVAEIRYGGIIPAGLAKRVTGKVDPSVQKLTTKAAFRVLDFQMVE